MLELDFELEANELLKYQDAMHCVHHSYFVVSHLRLPLNPFAQHIAGLPRITGMLPHPQGLYLGLRRQDRKTRQASLLHGPERGTADHGADAQTDTAAHSKADAQADSS